VISAPVRFQRFQRSLIAIGTLICGLAVAACGPSKNEQARVASARDALRAAVERKTRPPYVTGDRDTHVWQEARRFYKQNDYSLVWSDGSRPRAALDSLITAVRAADQEGLVPGDYGIDELARMRESFDPSHAADADLRFTYAYLRYAWDVAHGTIDPEDIDPQWHAAARDVDLHGALAQALDANRIEESLRHLAPQAPQYQGLKDQLARLRSRSPSPADDVARATARQAAKPDSTPPNDASTLVATSEGKDVALTTPEAIELIAMNMDRWRWLPDDLGSRYIIVNIPAFRLDVIEDGRSVLDMKVVTGKKDSPTPVLADRMTTIVFSPYWNIPRDIVEKEIAPKADKDPSYLERENIEIDDSGHYRQRPGKGNSLGLVKFLFPNHYNVYLHDTPADALFARVERDFSHGCVRLDQPLALAKYVLGDQPEWTEEKITAAMNSGTEQAVALKRPLPIYLVYFTAWDENGRLQVRNDVYGYDRRHRVADQ